MKFINDNYFSCNICEDTGIIIDFRGHSRQCKCQRLEEQTREKPMPEDFGHDDNEAYLKALKQWEKTGKW